MGHDADIVSTLAGQISWRELIHTAYFHNARFVKLIAYGMLALSGMPPSAQLKSDPDYPAVEDWFAWVSGGR